MKLAVVIPAYNESKTIAQVIANVPKNLPGVKAIRVIVVDDNSADRTSSEAEKAGATVLRHRVNLGAGGATLTGIAAASRLGFNAVVTLDADGQHNPGEIAALVRAHKDHSADLVIGSRFLSKSIKKMPPLKNFGNRVMNFITWLFSGRAVTDSQSGFRLFGQNMMDSLSAVTASGYEFCSETIVRASQKGLKIVETPISTIYFEGRRGQSPVNGINIAMKLFFRRVAP